jgi:hypothetical protein
MKTTNVSALIIGLFASTVCIAAAPPADAPAGATGLCKDGTYYTGAEKKGACKGHKGVKDWYADVPAAKPDAKAATTKTATPASASASSPASAQSSKTSTPPAEAAPGGGPGKVWANESSKVYHCMGDKWYGKTKKGEYMSEADAKAKGFRADHGKACQS